MRAKSIFSEKLLLSYILIIFLIITSYLSYTLNIWEDELYSLKSTQGGVFSTIRQALNFEGQPPVYFVLLNLWRHIDNGIFFCRMFSIFSIVIATIVLFKLSKIYVPDFNPVLFCAFFLINPYTIWASTEIRHYAFSVLLSILLLYYFNKGFISKEDEKTNKFLYYIFAFLSLYTFYYFSFFLFANGTFLIIKKKYKEFLYYSLFMALILVPIFFIFKTIDNQITIHDETLFPPEGFLTRIMNVLKSTQNFLFSMQLMPFGTILKLIMKLFFFWIFLYGIIKMELNKSRKKLIDNDNNLFLLIAIVIIYILYLIVLNVYPQLYFADRYLVVVYPLLILLIVKFIWYLFTANWQKYSILAIMTVIFIFGNYESYKTLVKKYDYKVAAVFLEHDIKDSRPILFYAGFLSPIFEYYYKGSSKLAPLPDSSCYNNNYFATIKNKRQLDSIFRTFGTEHLCLVSDEQIGNRYAVDFNRKMIEDYLKTQSIIEQDTIFYGRANYYYLKIVKFKLTDIKEQ